MKLTFLEIGTSDFDTCIQTAEPNVVGISVEPVKLYFDRLPSRDGVIRVNAAISANDGHLNVFYVNPDVIEAHKMPSWLRGCNSVNKPHYLAVEQLTMRGMDPETFITKETIEALSFKTLVKRYDIESINYLKIDTEGHDLIILAGYLDVCDKQPHLFADRILFETNAHTKVEDQDTCIRAFLERGYHVESRGHDTVLTRASRL